MDEWDSKKAYYSPWEVAKHLGISMDKLAAKMRLYNMRTISLPGRTEGISTHDVREIEESIKQK